jgi:hypothetical protein
MFIVPVEMFVSSKLGIVAIVINASALVNPVLRFKVLNELFVPVSFVTRSVLTVPDVIRASEPFNVPVDIFVVNRFEIVTLVINALALVIPVDRLSVELEIFVDNKLGIVAI